MKIQPMLRGLAGVLALLVPSRKGRAIAAIADGAADLLPDPGPVEEILTRPEDVLQPAPVPVATPIPLSDDDFLRAWLTVYGEARGEGWEGKVAVAWVIRNRLAIAEAHNGRYWWGSNVSAICRARAQFSCWADDNRLAMDAVSPADPVARECQRAVIDVFGGILPDPTINGSLRGLGGATHYYAPALIPAPVWAQHRPRLARIGGHDFYRVV